jgi:hypothetical protein
LGLFVANIGFIGVSLQGNAGNLFFKEGFTAKWVLFLNDDLQAKK